jgi:hypothetical protein
MIGFIRRRLGFGAFGFAQRSSLVLLSLFLLAPSTCRSRSFGSISSVINAIASSLVDYALVGVI